jgi:hypothetical protein
MEVRLAESLPFLLAATDCRYYYSSLHPGRLLLFAGGTG